MPPEPMRRVKSHLRSLYQYVNSLSVCAMTKASTAAMQGLHACKARLTFECRNLEGLETSPEACPDSRQPARCRLTCRQNVSDGAS